MKKELITIIKLIASEGHVLTNGESYASVKYLASSDECEKWYEITEEEYQKTLEVPIAGSGGDDSEVM